MHGLKGISPKETLKVKYDFENQNLGENYKQILRFYTSQSVELILYTRTAD